MAQAQYPKEQHEGDAQVYVKQGMQEIVKEFLKLTEEEQAKVIKALKQSGKAASQFLTEAQKLEALQVENQILKNFKQENLSLSVNDLASKGLRYYTEKANQVALATGRLVASGILSTLALDPDHVGSFFASNPELMARIMLATLAIMLLEQAIGGLIYLASDKTPQEEMRKDRETLLNLQNQSIENPEKLAENLQKAQKILLKYPTSKGAAERIDNMSRLIAENSPKQLYQEAQGQSIFKDLKGIFSNLKGTLSSGIGNIFSKKEGRKPLSLAEELLKQHRINETGRDKSADGESQRNKAAVTNSVEELHKLIKEEVQNQIINEQINVLVPYDNISTDATNCSNDLKSIEEKNNKFRDITDKTLNSVAENSSQKNQKSQIKVSSASEITRQSSLDRQTRSSLEHIARINGCRKKGGTRRG